MMWDFIKDRQFYSRQFIGSGSSSDVMPYSDSN
jgi:WD40 repeat protein